VILLMSTVSPSQAKDMNSRVQSIRPDVTFVDSPVSGGTIRAATGDLTLLVSGLEAADDFARSSALAVLSCLSSSQGNSKNLMLLSGGAGRGTAVKLVNQHLAGKHYSSKIRI
jgi:3-hydroxyisobutyrate dehydrogenase